MQTILWNGCISCLQGSVCALSESDRQEVVRNIANGNHNGITESGILWDIQLELSPQCCFTDLDKPTRKLIAKSLLNGNTSGTITTQSICKDKGDIKATSTLKDNTSGLAAETIPVRVTKATFNSVIAVLNALCEDVQYANRAKLMIAGITDNAKFSNVSSSVVCLFTIGEIQELITLLSCNTLYPELDFFQLIQEKQENISR